MSLTRHHEGAREKERNHRVKSFPARPPRVPHRPYPFGESVNRPSTRPRLIPVRLSGQAKGLMVLHCSHLLDLQPYCVLLSGSQEDHRRIHGQTGSAGVVG